MRLEPALLADVLPSRLARYLRVPAGANAQRRQLLYGLMATVFGPLLLVIGLVSLVTVGWGFAISWVAFGMVFLASLPVTLRGHSTVMMVVFIAACLLSSVFVLVREPQNPAALGGLVVVVIITAATENLRTTLVVSALATAAALLPLLAMAPGQAAGLPVGANLPSRTALMVVVTTIGTCAAYFNERILTEARTGAERNEALASRLQASMDNLEEQVAERTMALARRNLELERVNEALDTSIRRELQLAEQLRRLAETDDLTGLTNRRGFLARLEQALPGGGWLALADLDHFKRVNDDFGHVLGDHVLRRVAAAVAQAVSGDDRVARIGGEEFAILMPDRPGAVRDREAVRHDVERVVAAVRGLEWTDLATEVPPGWRITISIGAARFTAAPSGSERISDLLRRSDQALFAAKDAGRDRAVVASDPHRDRVGRRPSGDAPG